MKILYIMGIVIGIGLLILAGYIFVNINFVISTINGQVYDGFGFPHLNGEPSSPYTLLGYITFLQASLC